MRWRSYEFVEVHEDIFVSFELLFVLLSVNSAAINRGRLFRE